tara:strand:+ start:1022 stop:1711 length:690 start_codon:yes stop_codon:yes gene_type:complete
MKTLVLIPARSGSKGIKNKNLRKINNRPLIEYTFHLAEKLKNIDDIILSTDSKKIVKKSIKYKKIKSPFLRPKNLSLDNTKMQDVAVHTIEYLKRKKKNYDYLLLLQPTTPFRKISEVNKIINFVHKNSLKSLYSVSRSWQHPSEFIEVNNKKEIKYFSKSQDTNRQKFKKVYFINGAIYMIDINYFIKKKKFITKKSVPFLMSDETLIDIDTNFHLRLADSYSNKFNL